MAYIRKTDRPIKCKADDIAKYIVANGMEANELSHDLRYGLAADFNVTPRTIYEAFRRAAEMTGRKATPAQRIQRIIQRENDEVELTREQMTSPFARTNYEKYHHIIEKKPTTEMTLRELYGVLYKSKTKRAALCSEWR